MDNKNSIFLIDKPAGWTSFDVVAKLRSEIRKQLIASSERPIAKSEIRVGHAGTLDPFATGLLIILIGKATKRQVELMKLNKEYEATLFLGATSTTGDPEGTITSTPSRYSEAQSKNDSAPTTKEIEDTLKKFTGDMEQTPPQYSAIKINGQRAYKLARAGIKADLKSRKIKIYKTKLLNYTWPKLKIKVNCSSGTYIRTLAEDIGKELGCGAYLTELRRTKIGNFDIKDAISIDKAI